ncbi:MAG: integrin alpha, partial [Candidatus Anstonellales archaeon]
MKQVQGQNDREERNVIARRSRSNPIFNFLLRIYQIFANITNFKFPFLISSVYFLSTFYLLLGAFAFAQETYNLEIIFKTKCPLDSMETFGISLSSAGDVNNDSFDDI